MQKNKLKYNRGEMGLGAILLLLLVGLFVIWVLAGGANKQETPKPFIIPYTDTQNPGGTYGPGGR